MTDGHQWIPFAENVFMPRGHHDIEAWFKNLKSVFRYFGHNTGAGVLAVEHFDGLSEPLMPPVEGELNGIFLHAKPWIPGGKKSIFTVVIH